VSVAAKKWVRRHSPAKGSARTVLGELAWAGDAHGRGARMSHGQLVKATGLSRATVQRSLGELERDDLIRRHRGCGCDECGRAARGVVVFDVVMPEQPELEQVPGQMTLLAGSESPGRDVPHVRQVVRQVTEADLPQGEAGSCLRVRHLEDIEEEGQQQRQYAREPESIGHHPLVERVVEALEPTRLFVDLPSLSQVVMRYGDREDFEDALLTVLALAGDPAYRLPKGGAAKMLLNELLRPAPAGRFRSAAPAPRGDGELPDRFAKYDVAVGLR
jgi:DNA-binding Lrp family transcriptional regulator